MMWGYDYGYPMTGYGGYGVEHVFSSIFWIVVSIVLIVMAVRFMRGKPIWHCRGYHGANAALDILKERYAKGEIDKKEFEEKKHDLSA